MVKVEQWKGKMTVASVCVCASERDKDTQRETGLWTDVTNYLSKTPAVQL